MEEWENELFEQLGEVLNHFLEKGLTRRQCLGVLCDLGKDLLSDDTITFTPEE